MAQSYVTFTGNGSSTGPITLGFNYILKAHVKVYEGRDILANTGTLKSETTHYTFNTAGTQISMVTAPANGVIITIERQTPNDDQIVPYADGSNLIADSLNNSDKQTLFCTQELEDRQELSAAKAEAARVSAATATTNVSTLTSTQFNKDGSDTLSGNLTVTGTVDGRDVAADGTKLDTIESGATADQTNAEIRTAVEAASDSNVFTDADHTKLNAIEANATQDQTASEIRALVESASDSNVFTDADHTKLNAIESGATGDQSNAEIRAAVEAASDSNVFTDADHTKVNNAATLTDGQTLTNKTLTSPVINDMSGTAVVTSGTSTSDNKTYSAKRAGEIFYGKDTVGEIQSGETWSAGDDKVATTAAIDARITDLVDDVGGFVPIANETSFPNANPDVNNGAGTLVSIKALSSNLTSNGSGVASIANGTVGNSTVTINGLANSTTYASTFGMIVETTTTLNTYTFHRLVPKATEVTTVSGSISNVNTVAGAISNVNSVASNASNITATANNQSNINSAVANASNINAAVANASNINTTAGSISNVNLVGGSISNVNSVASNLSTVNDFAARYRTGANNPTDSLDVGDLFFNTSANELKVYNGSAWQGGVTASGNFASITGNTFTGDNLYNDGVKAKFGTDSDFQAYHDNTNAYLMNQTGTLRVRGNDIRLQDVNGETYIKNTQNGAVSLYYDDSKKLESTSDGVRLPDGQSLTLGDGGDVKLKHQSNHFEVNNTSGNTYFQSNGAFYLRGKHSGSTESMLVGNVGASVDLYHDNVKSFETTSTGAKVSGSKLEVINTAGAGDAQLYLEAGEVGTAYIQFIADNGDDNTDKSRILQADGANLKLQNYDSGSWATKFETTSTGAQVNGDLVIEGVSGTANKLKIPGDGNTGCEINHQSGHFQVTNTQGNTYFQSNGGFNLRGKHSGTTESMLIANTGGSVDLYFDNSKKLSTTSSGVQIDDSTFNVIKAHNSHTIATVQNNYGGNATAQLKLISPTDEFNFIKYASGNAYIQLTNSADIIYTIGGSERLRLLSDGKVRVPDNGKFVAGSSNDLELWHQTGNSYITSTGANLTLRAAGHLYIQDIDGNNMADFTDGGAVELYFDGVRKAYTNSSGFVLDSHLIMGDDDIAKFGNGADLQIYHSGLHSYIKDTGTGELVIQGSGVNIYDGNNKSLFYGVTDGYAALYYNNSKRLETSSSGASVLGSLYCSDHINLTNDGKYIQFGDSNDLRIQHTGSNSLIKHEGGGDLYIDSYNKDIYLRAGDGNSSVENSIVCNNNAGVDVYHSGSKVFETLGNGVRVQGGIMFGSDTADANRITDYEEGSWTPDFYHHSSVSNVYGHYTKIGRMVYAYFTGVAYSTSGSHQYISNLPFTTANIGGGVGGVARGYQNFDIQDGPIYYVENNSTQMTFYKDNGSAMSAADCNGKSLRGMVVYTAAS